jgi:hypothetical protein
MDSLPPPRASPSALEIAETCPKIPALVAGWKTCGKAGCRCGRGEPHGPYWSLRWRDGGAHRRRHVRPADLPAVRAAVERRRRERAVLRAELAESASILRALKALYRELDDLGIHRRADR